MCDERNRRVKEEGRNNWKKTEEEECFPVCSGNARLLQTRRFSKRAGPNPAHGPGLGRHPPRVAAFTYQRKGFRKKNKKKLVSRSLSTVFPTSLPSVEDYRLYIK